MSTIKTGQSQGVNNRVVLKIRSLGQLPLFAVFMIGLLTLASIFANVIAPHSPTEINPSQALLPPAWTHGGTPVYPLGTDDLGRDILSRLIFGARVSMIVSLTAIALGGAIGTALGMIAGYLGGWVQPIIMRTVDVVLSFPLILLGLLFAAIYGASFTNVIIVVGAIVWARFSRLVQGQVLHWKAQDFVEQARIGGCSNFRIIIRHILPNVLNSVVVLSTLMMGWAIIVEASLSFLGAGVPPPTPSWGGMVSDGRNYITTAWWLSVFPGFAILLVVLSLNSLGDWLRDRLDPKLRQI